MQIRWLLITAFLFSILIMGIAQERSDTIVAIVNEEIITYGELVDKIREPLQEIEASSGSLREKEVQRQTIMQKVLQDMVDQKLMLQEAKRYNINISDKTIKEKVEEELSSKSSTPFSASEVDLEELMRSQLTLRELFQKKTTYSKEVRAVIDTFVPPMEVKYYYERNIAEFTKQNKIKTRFITLFYSRNGGREQTLAKADGIVKQLREGASFEEMARLHSNGPYAKEGGTWPRIERDGAEVWDFFGKGEALHREVEDIAFSLKQGEISEPIPLDSEPWCHIVKIEAIQYGGVVPFEEAQEMIRIKLRNEKVLAALMQMRARLRERAFIWPPNLFEGKK